MYKFKIGLEIEAIWVLYIYIYFLLFKFSSSFPVSEL